ncbi:hypothetical protein Glove_78g212 [Diversispora epigaea]|uniref:Uncharacterized protein n=1 Tax=Diversispora epigaea TaxID=1348612 RepID=A0A397JCY8_9GLOM|nr:hypothetical protein Glove_78g212 [Diversispora epigaea]
MTKIFVQREDLIDIRKEVILRNHVNMKECFDSNTSNLAGLEQVNNYFWSIPNLNIYAATVPDRMHHLDLGLFKYQIEFTMELLKKKKSLNKVNERIADIPRHSQLKVFKKGIQLFRLTASEYRDMMKIMVFVVDDLQIKDLSEVYVKWNEMYLLSRSEKFKESDLENFQKAIDDWANLFIKLFQKISNSHLKFLKLHSWIYHIVNTIWEYGVINGYTTETYESLHKTYVKISYRLSNKKEVEKQIIENIRRRAIISRNRVGKTKTPMAFVYTAKLFDFDLSESMIEQNKKNLNLNKKMIKESTTPIIIESGGEEPETRATKRRRTEKGREEQYSEGENESTLARKKKEDRTLNYLVKIDKEVGDLRKEVSDIRKIMENSKMMKESDEMYDQTFINKITSGIKYKRSSASKIHRSIASYEHHLRSYSRPRTPLYNSGCIGKIANKSISKKIYPNSKKLKEISARFLANKYPELFENWSNKRWTFYFDMILQRKLVERHRSRRGALSTQIRKSIFSVFRSLPKINMKSTPSEIKAWKSLLIVKQCYEKLHSKLENDETTWCGKIINETWQDTSKVSKEQISFVVAICESFLNPNNEILKNDNKFLSKRLKRNLKKMETGREFDLKDSDSNEETESDSSTSDEDEDEDEDEGEVSRNEGEGSGERRSEERNEERRSEERERRSRERSEERNEEREGRRRRRSEEREGRRSEEREGRRSGERRSGERRSVGRSVERRSVERRSEERRSEREERNEWE